MFHLPWSQQNDFHSNRPGELIFTLLDNAGNILARGKDLVLPSFNPTNGVPQRVRQCSSFAILLQGAGIAVNATIRPGANGLLKSKAAGELSPSHMLMVSGEVTKVRACSRMSTI